MTRKFLKSLKLLLEITLLSGMAAVPAILVHMGARLTVTTLGLIWLALGIPLCVLLAFDLRAMRRAEETAKEQETREYLEWLRKGERQ